MVTFGLMIGSITKSVLSYGVPRTVRSIIPCRQANTLADDINQVVLLGRVNSVHLNEKSDKAYASIGLITKNTYKSSTGYSSKFAYHNVYVFSQPLFNKIRN
ncbi:unnamed protein product [Heterobilharzia americana]|nr:unnamed protein product [Heterobilharzia americana]